MTGRAGNGQHRDTGPSSDDSVVAQFRSTTIITLQRRTPICTNSQVCSQVLTRFEKHHDSYAIMTGGLCRAPNSASQCRSVAVFSSGAFASARSLEPTWDRAVSFNRSQQKASHTPAAGSLPVVRTEATTSPLSAEPIPPFHSPRANRQTDSGAAVP
jgi:hypothetical protein